VHYCYFVGGVRHQRFVGIGERDREGDCYDRTINNCQTIIQEMSTGIGRWGEKSGGYLFISCFSSTLFFGCVACCFPFPISGCLGRYSKSAPIIHNEIADKLPNRLATKWIDISSLISTPLYYKNYGVVPSSFEAITKYTCCSSCCATSCTKLG
jgi:hypothetical protein